MRQGIEYLARHVSFLNLLSTQIPKTDGKILHTTTLHLIVLFVWPQSSEQEMIHIGHI